MGKNPRRPNSPSRNSSDDKIKRAHRRVRPVWLVRDSGLIFTSPRKTRVQHRPVRLHSRMRTSLWRRFPTHHPPRHQRNPTFIQLRNRASRHKRRKRGARQKQWRLQTHRFRLWNEFQGRSLHRILGNSWVLPARVVQSTEVLGDVCHDMESRRSTFRYVARWDSF